MSAAREGARHTRTDAETAVMKIVQLQAENLKKLKAVEITPAGNVVEITGRNGQGKSSVLDAIWWALAGAGNVQSEPIRKGADEARIMLDLGELKITRRFKRAEADFTTSIVVENGEGARFQSPQKMLDAMLGALTFDPLAFTRMDARAQFNALKRFVPGVNFALIEEANRIDYAKRTDVNRRARDARARAGGIKVPEDAPAHPIDDGELVARLEAAGKQNAEIETLKGRRDAMTREIEASLAGRDDCRARVERLLEEAKRIEAAASVHDAQAASLQAEIDRAKPLPSPIDTASLRAEIANARAHNDALAIESRARADRERLLAEATELDEQAAALTAAMDLRQANKLAAIAAADMPIEGIGFGEEEVLLNGLPFDQASSAEQLRASIAIAMASNPKLRVIRVQDGSLLDADSMRLLGEMAEAADYQVWVEAVQSDRPGAVILEDGEVKVVAPVAA